MILNQKIEELKSNHIIIATVNTDNVNFEEAHDQWLNLKKQFPNNPIIVIPDGMTIEFMDWKKLYDYMMSIKPKEGENG